MNCRPRDVMPYHMLADLVLVLHMAFIAFVLFGGLLALNWRWMVWLHLPAAAWGVVVECTGWLCPLTPLEEWLRTQAGRDPYGQDFVGHYLLPILYPSALTRNLQILLGAFVLAMNAVVYAWLWRNWNKAHLPRH